MSDIKFGTSGHRGIIGQTFTMAHIRAIVHAISAYFDEHNISSPKILFGYDTRTGNSPTLDPNSYTYCVVSELTSLGIHVDVCDNYTATPIISWAVKTNDYHLGIILTASHNPPNYNGIKINDSMGAPASLEMTSWIESKANELKPTIKDKTKKIHSKRFKYVNYLNPFLDHTKELIKTTFQLPLTDFNGTYIIDPKCGSAISVWKQLTESSNGTIIWKNNQHSAHFNQELPNPTSQTTIDSIGALCKEHNCIGFSNDPDADRHIMIDELGNAVSPEKILAIILHYCNSTNINIQSVSSTLANSAIIKTICQRINIVLHETNIGFKFFTPYLKSADASNAISFGVESSGGFSMSSHSYDKCGFLPILIIIGIMKKQGMPLSSLSHQIDEIFGKLIFVEDALELDTQEIGKLNYFAKTDRTSLQQLFETEISSISTSDGIKITFNNNDWVLSRPSGTEPLIRIYAESTSEQTARQYIQKITQFFSSSID